MKKLLFIILSLFISISSISAMEVKDIKMYAEAEIAGGIRIRELIKVKNMDEDLIVNVYLKNKNAKVFDGTKESFNKSEIYNGTSVGMYGSYKVNSDKINYEAFGMDEFVTDDFEKIDVELNDNKNEYTIKVDKSDEEESVYYLDYVVTNILVQHNDCAELYYRFLDNFYYDVDNIEIIVGLPYKSELFKVWAHGNKNMKTSIDENESIVHNKITNYKKGSYIENRILFDKSIFGFNINKDKISGMDAIDAITEMENNRNKNTSTFNILELSLGIGIGVLVILFFLYLYYSKIYLKRRTK